MPNTTIIMERVEKECLKNRPDVAERFSQKVLQFTLDGKLVKEWQSAMECSRNGFNQGHISECCGGKRKKHKGFIWKHKE